MDNSSRTTEEIKRLFIHSVMSQREEKAIREIYAKIAETKCVDISQIDPSNVDMKVYQAYMDCCHDNDELSILRDRLIAKQYDIISSIPDSLPECQALKKDYDNLILALVYPPNGHEEGTNDEQLGH